MLQLQSHTLCFLFNAHTHESVMSIDHSLKSNSPLAVVPAARAGSGVAGRTGANASGVALCAAACPVTSRAPWTRTPWRRISLHWTLQNW